MRRTKHLQYRTGKAAALAVVEGCSERRVEAFAHCAGNEGSLEVTVSIETGSHFKTASPSVLLTINTTSGPREAPRATSRNEGIYLYASDIPALIRALAEAYRIALRDDVLPEPAEGVDGWVANLLAGANPQSPASDTAVALA